MSRSLLTSFVFVLAVAMRAFAWTSASFAGTVNMDFQPVSVEEPATPLVDYTGVAAAPDTGVFWNTLGVDTSNVISPLLFESDGTTLSTISMQLIYGNGYNNVHSSFPTFHSGIAPGLMDDYSYNAYVEGPFGNRTVGLPTFSIHGLTDGVLYDVYLYSANGKSANTTTVFTLDGGAGTATATNTGQSGSFIENNNYVLFAGITTTSPGQISGTYDAVSGVGGASLNGIQVAPSQPVLPGDVNFDGVVNIFDINLVSTNWGTPGGPTGDANSDGNVDIFDINLISSNWTLGGSTAVPEPSTCLLLALGGGLALTIRGHRRSRSV